MASVVPPLTGTMIAMVRDYFGRVAAQRRAGREQRACRFCTTTRARSAPIASSTASRPTRSTAARDQRPVIVVDFGTATTFDAISAKGEYLGGVICPGPQISADALFQRAARLPRIDVRKPDRVIGRTTVGSMQSGLFWGYVDMVEGLVRRMRAELGGQRRGRRDRRSGGAGRAGNAEHRARRSGADAARACGSSGNGIRRQGA